ncbi:hypothetical protein BDF21DRAFT_411090, partial [Thamnidium elegans]
MVHIKRLKSIISSSLLSKKKKEKQQEDEQDTIICPSIYNDNDTTSLSSTLFLPDDSDTISIASYHPNVYSNLYERLPNGNWLVSYRTRDERLIGTCEVSSCM